MLFNSPLSEEKANRIISVLNLNPDSKVLDIGCGEGEFLTRIHQMFDTQCLGIDINSSCIESANQKISNKKLRFLCSDIQNAQIDKSSFDLAVCIGSTHAFGQGKHAYPNALRQMLELVKPNGLLLLGEGYWKRAPDQEYLEFLGEPVGIYNDHEQNILQAEALGLIPLYAAVSNQDEWDHFEWSYRMKAERQAIAESKNEGALKKLDRIRGWNQYYRKFGRTTMGFGFYLFLKPE